MQAGNYFSVCLGEGKVNGIIDVGFSITPNMPNPV